MTTLGIVLLGVASVFLVIAATVIIQLAIIVARLGDLKVCATTIVGMLHRANPTGWVYPVTPSEL